MCHFVPVLLIALLSWLITPPLLASNKGLPKTGLLESDGDIASQMVEGIHRFLDRKTAESQTARDRIWDTGDNAQQVRQRAESRERLRKMLGAVDQRISFAELEVVGGTDGRSSVGRGRGYEIFRIRWPVFEGVTGEGLLLQPEKKPFVRVVAVPDADWSPEMLVGLEPGVPPAAQFAQKLAEAGCQVVIPTIIDRKDTWSGILGVRMTNQPHREFIYRMSYEVGRHIIGYEVQKILAVIDWFDKEDDKSPAMLTAVMGYGEGGLLALYAAVLDRRIDRTVVSGYFQPREELWKEPIYRNVWGLLREFGDAELARLIDPYRGLIVEACAGTQVAGPPVESLDRKGATPNGSLQTPSLESVTREIKRSRGFNLELPKYEVNQFVVNENGRGFPGSNRTLHLLLEGTPAEALIVEESPPPVQDQAVHQTRSGSDAVARMKRQFDELVSFTQKLLRQSSKTREELWAKTDSSSPERWKATTRPLRNLFWEEVIGRLPDPDLPMNPRTRLIYDEPKFRGYEVMLDVWEDVFAFGILLVPKDLKDGERRPVVVCQHGLEGRASDVVDPRSDSPYYHRFGARLAEQGFITFAPQNPYVGKDRFRLLLRKSHPLKLSLFSFIIGQHQRILEWLSSLPFVDPVRIGFYGLSYGGKTAMRVPTLLDGYALSICSADFNEWVWKTTSVESRYSYMIMNEYDMYEFNLANIANYAELATLMAPRPFMVERGHGDEVAPDEWVAYEFAKVRQFYVTKLGLPDRCAIEFFNGPHTINGKGTFEFLKRYLGWPGF